MLSDLTPKIDAYVNHFYSYEKIDGNVLYDVLNEGLMFEFLDWCNNKLWNEKKLDSNGKSTFFNACNKFYKEKTDYRLNKFYEKTFIKGC